MQDKIQLSNNITHLYTVGQQSNRVQVVLVLPVVASLEDETLMLASVPTVSIGVAIVFRRHLTLTNMIDEVYLPNMMASSHNRIIRKLNLLIERTTPFWVSF